ncbi:MAG TPA: NAD-dependent epimerase/dehydratase family protein [Thermomicrobiales bacterium]|nr:NAD-dependent epimerase/dehydratase family protein [Thermomicrobiales bacterium]
MRVAVTGGTGFIGRTLVPALAAAGHEVTVVARHPAPVHGAARALAGDVADRGIGAALAGAEAIVHLAGLSDASASLADPVGYTTVNALGTLNVLEAARDAGAGVVLASSQRVYEPWRGPLDEDAPRRPTTVYGYGKLAAETWAAMYARLYGVPVVTLRLFTVYGPGQRMGGGASGIVAIFGERALAGRELVVHNRHLRDFVYVEDAAGAFFAALARLRDPDVAGRAYNIATGVGTRLDDLAALVRDLSGMGERVPIRVLETDEPREEIVAVIDRARAALGYAPAVALRDGLARYLAWLRGQPPAGAGR